jgi:hypothetical protein
MEEVWKPVKGFENLYAISNFGYVKSLSRTILNSGSYSGSQTLKERILKPFPNPRGYSIVGLSKEDILYRFNLSTLVWDHFGEGKRDGRNLQVDHIDGDKKNNRVDNLQLLTNRGNTSKRFQERGRELPTGVSFYKSRNKYRSYIYINRLKHLGYFETISEASQAYQNALTNLEGVK